MRLDLPHVLVTVVLGLALAGCANNKLLHQGKTDTPGEDALASAEPDLLGSDANDDLSLGKKQYHANNFGLAEKYFRHAVELHPRDAEAWLGLAASCDRLRRFDLADRAYAQAIGIVGSRPEILNNQGYSYMLRGDYKRAEQTLALAQSKDPSNKFVQSNLLLLHEAARTGKAIE
jgi:Flp pilus assembly protein TadD